MEFLLGLPIYFFSVRLYPKSARNASIRKKHKVLTPIANGHVNQSFVDERTHENGKIANGNANNATHESKKKKPAPFPPLIQNDIQNAPKTVTTPLELDIALAALDDVLSVAEQNNRKVSVVSSVSNASASKEENVVALIHREDIKSNTNSPLIENSPSKLELGLVDENQNQVSNSASNLVKAISNDKQVVSENTEFISGGADSKEISSDITVVPENADSSPNQLEISSNEPILETASVNDSDKLPDNPENNVENKSETNDESSSVKSDINALVNQIENDHENTLAPPAPPPPLMNLFDSVEEVKLPRVSLRPTANDLKSVKLKKHRPTTPPADYTVRGLPAVLKDDHISFGTKDFEDFKSVLSNKLFKNGNPVLRQNSFVTKKPTNILPQNSLASNEFVIKDKLDIGNAKNTINEMLLKRNSVSTTVVPQSPQSEINVEPPLPELNEENVKKFHNLILGDANILDHKKRMASTLKSIRLRKVDSFKKEQ